MGKGQPTGPLKTKVTGNWKSSIPGVVYRGTSAFDKCPTCESLKKRTAKQCKPCQVLSNRPPELFDTFIVNGEPCRQLPLTQSLYAVVDDCLYDDSMRFNWIAKWNDSAKCFYASRAGCTTDGKYRHIFLHHFVLGIGVDGHRPKVDHINHNTLDNRRSNLRICTTQQNTFNRGPQKNNSSGFKGVHWSKKMSKWVARIKHHGRGMHIGVFSVKEEAALAYDAVALELFGDFAWLNFPPAGRKQAEV